MDGFYGDWFGDDGDGDGDVEDLFGIDLVVVLCKV